MFRLLPASRKSPVLAALYACILVLVFTSSADAKWILHWEDVDPDGNGHAIFENDTTGKWFVAEYWYDHLVDFYEIPPGNPSPDGSSTGLGPDKKDIQTLADKLKKFGGNPVQETNFLKTAIGLALVESGKLPGFIDPWDAGSMMPGEGGVGGHGGGFDPGLPLGEQIGKRKRQGKGKDDDGDDGDGGGGGDIASAADIQPDVIDPPPEPIGKNTKSPTGLWDVPVSKNAASHARNSFVLMSSFAPSAAGPRGPGKVNVPGLGRANMLGDAMSRQAMGFQPGALGGTSTVRTTPTGTGLPLTGRLR